MNESSAWAILFIEEEVTRFMDDRMDLEYIGGETFEVEVYE